MINKRIIVIGGGASGMIAAGRAAELSTQVILLERKEQAGNKILISGNTRCNLSNTCNLDDFIAMYGENGRFLYGAFHHFFHDDLLKLLNKFGVKTAAEQDGRVFPASGKASDIVKCLLDYMAEGKVQIVTGSRVTKIQQRGGSVISVFTKEQKYDADAVVLATGGVSYPQTGSSGDGYEIAANLGHTIIGLKPALVPLVVKEHDLAKGLQGISLKEIRITSFACKSEDIEAGMIPKNETGRGIRGKKAHSPVIESRNGDLLFTHYGLSGPAVLLMSLSIVEALETGPASITIDLVPAINERQLQEQLQEEFSEHGTRYIHTILEKFVVSRLVDFILMMTEIDPHKKAHQVSADERLVLAKRIKDLRFNIKSGRPISEAMVTAGGVALTEIDPQTMESKLINSLYLCGEVIDIDADTGGYNLQAAFSTGYLAGESAARSG